MTTVLRVRQAGPLVTVQDGGRPGMMRFGVPGSGAMDRLALAAANVALGREPGAAVIEISPGGLTLDCLAGETGFSIAGGGFAVDHAGRRGTSWQVGRLSAGESLSVRPGHQGNWCCLAFAGQLDAPEWLGSRATHSLSGLGGGKIVAGQELTLRDTPPPPFVGPIPCPIQARPRSRIAVIPGPQERFFTPGTRDTFLTAHWRISPSFDRMGLRLTGPEIAPAAALDMPSEPVLRGSVQVAGDGVPVVLMADHQTTGGYPKIATVADFDLDALAQLRPNEALHFHAITPEAAVARTRLHAAAIGRYLTALATRAG